MEFGGAGRAVGMCGQELSVGCCGNPRASRSLRGAGQRLPRSVAPDTSSCTRLHVFSSSSETSHPVLPLTSPPLWPTSWTLPLWALGYDFLSISFGSCFIFFCVGAGRSGGGDRVRGLENQRGVGY